MKVKFKYLLLFILIIVPFEHVFSKKNNHLVIHGSYTFETYDGQENIAVYMSLFNTSDKDIQIDSFSSDLSSRIEMHDIKFTNDIAKMVMIKEVVVKGKSELYLQPGGKHLMFFGIKEKLNDGDSFDIQVNLKNGTTHNVKTMVLNKNLKSKYLN
ncbi:MAG: hypothetical protein CL572_01385 [Alphaproteobacteria bacterium]|jgi:copper(I)-binding protein|nr:hypothetical protein [Alphaproteobacteria bacterium]|tara:strand:+ start:340 stop:804 length:465 start_codon:yes stop_codon:yes gene_type:complete